MLSDIRTIVAGGVFAVVVFCVPMTGDALAQNDNLQQLGRVHAYVARLSEAECYRDLGQPQKAWNALAVFEDLSEQELNDLSEEHPGPLTLENRARALRMEVGVDPKLKKYDQCIELYKKWEKASTSERKTPEALAIQFFAAEAMLARGTQPGCDESELRQTAKRLLQVVADVPNEYQERAKKRLAEKA